MSREPNSLSSLTEILNQYQMTGISVAVISSSQIWKHESGWADSEKCIAIQPESKFLIYSLTKTFLAVLVLKLVETEQVDLDSRLSCYLPNAPFASLMTIRQILHHTSGLPDYGPLTEYQKSVQENPSEPWSEEGFFKRTCNGGSLQFEPGSSFSYSNIGYMILRLLVENLTGKTFAQNISELITVPLGLTKTGVVKNQDDMEQLVWSSSTNIISATSKNDLRHLYHPGWVSHGVIASTAEETAKFYAALFNGVLIDHDLLQQMTTMFSVEVKHPFFKNPGYGLGLMGEPDNGGIYGHTGAGPGYCASAYYFNRAKDPFTIAVLSNSENAGKVDAILFAIAATKYSAGNIGEQ